MSEQELIDAALSEMWSLYDQAMMMLFWRQPVEALALLRQARSEYDKLSEVVKQSARGSYWGEHLAQEISKLEA